MAAFDQRMNLIDTLSHRWALDAAKLPHGGGAAFDEIITLHGQPQRRYHGLTHLSALFALLDAYVPKEVEQTSLHFCVWWHDAIYVPGEGDNEEKSAALARLRLDEMGADTKLSNQVSDIILATRNHWEGRSMGDGDYFLDADIAILGAPPKIYERYALDVRVEYSYLDDTNFRNGRTAFLRAALSRPRLFRTDIFHCTFDEVARANMTGELSRLGGTG